MPEKKSDAGKAEDVEEKGLIPGNSEIAIIDERTIRDKIYVVRGVQVMLDFELAEIYGYTTSAFNRQVKNNARNSKVKGLCFNSPGKKQKNYRDAIITSRSRQRALRVAAHISHMHLQSKVFIC